MDSREERPAQSVVQPAASVVQPAASLVQPAPSVGQKAAFVASVPATDSRPHPAPVARQAVAAVALPQAAGRVWALVGVLRMVAAWAVALRQAAERALVLRLATVPEPQWVRDGSRNQPPQPAPRAFVGGALQPAL